MIFGFEGHLNLELLAQPLGINLLPADQADILAARIAQDFAARNLGDELLAAQVNHFERRQALKLVNENKGQRRSCAIGVDRGCNLLPPSEKPSIYFQAGSASSIVSPRRIWPSPSSATEVMPKIVSVTKSLISSQLPVAAS